MPAPGITKKMMADAMKRFLSSRPLSRISVADIVEDCGLNRNSFYYHFKDKYDLVNWIFYTDFLAEINRGEITTSWDLIELMLSFFYENRLFYSNALKERGQNSFYDYFSEIMKSAVLARADEMFEDDGNHEFYANFFIDAFLAAVIRWLENGAKTDPGMMSELMKKAVTGAVIKGFGLGDTNE